MRARFLVCVDRRLAHFATRRCGCMDHSNSLGRLRISVDSGVLAFRQSVAFFCLARTRKVEHVGGYTDVIYASYV